MTGLIGLIIIVYIWGMLLQNISLRTLLCLESVRMEVSLLAQESMLIVNCLFPSLASTLNQERRDVGSSFSSAAK